MYLYNLRDQYEGPKPLWLVCLWPISCVCSVMCRWEIFPALGLISPHKRSERSLDSKGATFLFSASPLVVLAWDACPLLLCLPEERCLPAVVTLCLVSTSFRPLHSFYCKKKVDFILLIRPWLIQESKNQNRLVSLTQEVWWHAVQSWTSYSLNIALNT